MQAPAGRTAQSSQPGAHRRNHVASVLLGLALLICMAPQARAGLDGWTSGGPAGAVVNALAADPRSTGTVYAGTAGDGVFRSTDGGASWQAANGGLERTYVESLAIDDPAHPATLYAASPSRGVFMSTDGGKRWQAVNEGLRSLSAHHLALDAAASTLYAATNDGVFRRAAGGVWEPTALLTRSEPAGAGEDVSLHAWVDCLAFDPAGATLYACVFTWSEQPGPGWQLRQSHDAGATWQGIPVPSTGGPVAVAIDPSASSPTLYVATYEPPSSRSAVLRSADGGITWEPVGSAMPGCEPDCRVGDLSVASGGGRLYAATDHGVYTAIDNAADWTVFGSGLADTPVYSIAVDAVAPTIVYAGTSDGVFSFQRSGLCGGDCDGNGVVRIDELIASVDIALGQMAMDACRAADGRRDGAVGVDDLVSAVGHALSGCAD